MVVIDDQVDALVAVLKDVLGGEDRRCGGVERRAIGDELETG